MAELVVVIPALNAEAGVRSLLKQLGREPARVVVADGGSEDGTLRVAVRAGAVVAARSANASATSRAPTCGQSVPITHTAPFPAIARASRGDSDPPPCGTTSNPSHSFTRARSGLTATTVLQRASRTLRKTRAVIAR